MQVVVLVDAVQEGAVQVDAVQLQVDAVQGGAVQVDAVQVQVDAVLADAVLVDAVQVQVDAVQGGTVQVDAVQVVVLAGALSGLARRRRLARGGGGRWCEGAKRAAAKVCGLQ